MASAPTPPPPSRLTFTVWLILIIASIGFAFDIYELLMLPLVLPPALAELLPGVRPGTPEFNTWRALMFWVPAMAGGVFGLLGGYLTDLLGRRRVLTWSILLYAASAFLAGYSTSMTMLLILRTTTFVGVCVEFVAAVAWLAELFPNPEQREKALGYTQAFSSLGGLMIGGVFLLISAWARGGYLPALQMPSFLVPYLGEITEPHAAWRYTLISGLLPAIPLILIRPFLPESPIWEQKMRAGTLKRPSLLALFSWKLARTTIVTTLMVGLSYGAAFGAIQQMPQIAPGLPHVKEQIKEVRAEAEERLASLDEAQRKAEVARLSRMESNEAAGKISLWQEIGGLVGRFLLALLAVRIVSRQSLIRVFQVPGLIVVPLTFGFAATNNQTLFSIAGTPVTLLHIGMFFSGVLVVAQFSFWGNYLPRVYPVHLRGTGESVAHNIGGRMLGTSFAAVTSLASGLPFVPGTDDPMRIAYVSAAVALFVFLLGLLLSFLLPEPKEEEFAA